jgi:hypothetical protein
MMKHRDISDTVDNTCGFRAAGAATFEAFSYNLFQLGM